MIKRITHRLGRALAVALGAVGLFAASSAHADPFEVISNRYISIVQNYDELRWTALRVEGDPLDPRDDFLAILFSDTTQAQLPPVQATFVVSAPSVVGTGGFQQFRFGTTDNGAQVLQTPTLSPDGRTLVSSWRIPPDTTNDLLRDIIVTQKLSLVRDLVRVEYIVDNIGNSRNIGLRVTADPEPDPTDTVYSPTLFSRLGFFSNETELNLKFIPQRAGFQLLTQTQEALQFYPVASNPFSLTKQVIQGLDATTPDRMILGGYDTVIGGSGPTGNPAGGAGLRDINGRIVNTTLNFYDYVINPARFLLGSLPRGGDPVIASYFGPRSVGTRRQQRFVTYYGVGVADHGLARPRGGLDPTRPPAIAGEELFVSAVQTLRSIPLMSGIAGTDTSGGFGTFRADGFAMNLRNNLVIPGVVAQLGLPVGLEVDPTSPAPAAVDLGNLEQFPNAGGDDEKDVTWTIRINGEQAGVLPINVSFDSPLGTANVTRRVNIPQGKIYVFRKAPADPAGPFSPSMYTFPFRFDNPDPDVVFAPLSRAAGDYEIFRWNPDADGGLGRYEAVDQLVAGESYWIQLLPTAPVDTAPVVLNGATPIDIPGSGIGPGGSFSTQLRPFWNQVGNPSPYAVLLKDVRFQDSLTGQVLTFDDAVRQGFMKGSVWRFDRFAGQYRAVGMWDYVQPGEGVWMFSTRPVTVLWPAPRELQIQIT